MRHVSRIADSACPFLYWSQCKKGTLSQHFVMHVVPPLGVDAREIRTPTSYSIISPINTPRLGFNPGNLGSTCRAGLRNLGLNQSGLHVHKCSLETQVCSSEVVFCMRMAVWWHGGGTTNYSGFQPCSKFFICRSVEVYGLFLPYVQYKNQA